MTHARQEEGVLVKHSCSRILTGWGSVAQTTTATLHPSSSITDNADQYEKRKEAGSAVLLSNLVESLYA